MGKYSPIDGGEQYVHARKGNGLRLPSSDSSIKYGPQIYGEIWLII